MASEALTVYKLVRRFADDGTLRSAWLADGTSWASVLVGGWGRVVYKIDVPAEAPPWLQHTGYHLLAYRTLPAAAAEWRRWAGNDDYAVFEADADGEMPLPRQGSLFMISRGSLEVYDGPGGKWPEGTLMVRQLTLRRRMPEEVLYAV